MNIEHDNSVGFDTAKWTFVTIIIFVGFIALIIWLLNLF